MCVRLVVEFRDMWGKRGDCLSHSVLKAPLTDMLCWSELVCMPVACTCVRVCVVWRWVTILWLPPGLTERIQGSPGWGHHAQVKVLYLGPGKPANLLPTSYLPACRPLASHNAPHTPTHMYTGRERHIKHVRLDHTGPPLATANLLLVPLLILQNNKDVNKV